MIKREELISSLIKREGYQQKKEKGTIILDAEYLPLQSTSGPLPSVIKHLV